MKYIQKPIHVRNYYIQKFGAEKAVIIEILIDTQIAYETTEQYKQGETFWFPFEHKVLAQRLGCNPKTAGNHIKSLLKLGLLASRPSPSSNRKFLYRVIDLNLYEDIQFRIRNIYDPTHSELNI